MSKTLDMFPRPPKKPRAKPRVMAHVVDGGADFVRFECKKCGWDSDWLHIEENGFKEDDFRRGIPCKPCNKSVGITTHIKYDYTNGKGENSE